ncbi:DUF3027 domain-containing protein [Deinococcus aestuarii]|uniref:DUF3027 domain-containing protein n=1 Tax=Deinococcus aestuarii TaxID=2774531 RepID=UPI001C0CC86E
MSGYQYDDAQREEPHPQCWNCIYYVELTGKFASDWGVCTNALSAMDRRAMFERDGCEHHVETADR